MHGRGFTAHDRRLFDPYGEDNSHRLRNMSTEEFLRLVHAAIFLHTSNHQAGRDDGSSSQ